MNSKAQEPSTAHCVNTAQLNRTHSAPLKQMVFVNFENFATENLKINLKMKRNDIRKAFGFRCLRTMFARFHCYMFIMMIVNFHIRFVNKTRSVSQKRESVHTLACTSV